MPILSRRYLVGTLLVLSAFFTVPGSRAYAATEPPPIEAGHLLQKLSLRLRNTVPSREETKLFKADLAAHPDQFSSIYDQKIEDYLASAEFGAMVEGFHSVWWRLQPAESTQIARYIVTQDRPYSEIFNRNYIALHGTNTFPYLMAGIKTTGVLPTGSDQWRTVRLSDQETRFRSILGDLDFLNTFPDTASNRNRKRSNYVISTFLCESLAPTDPTPLVATVREGDPHGSNPNCIGCHYRLDPLARFFDHWRPPLPNNIETWFDPSQSASGTLIVRPAEGGRFDYAGQTENELGRILAGEPRVRACIANRVWQTILGASIKLDKTAAAGLAEAFDANDNFKDLVRAVVHHPYFWSTMEIPALRFADVRGSLQICTSCHAKTGSISPKFDPGSYPFDPVPFKNTVLLQRILGAVSHDPDYSPMPKAPAAGVQAQALTAGQLSSLREWIRSGAEDDRGNVTLQADEINEVLGEK